MNNEPKMEYQATAKYIRTSTRKLRLIADAIRGLSASVAIGQLSQMPKIGAIAMAKVLGSAVANATAKQVKVEDLKIKAIEVMGGPVMKRWHAVSRGQAHPFKKRMTHVRIIVTDENMGKKSSIVKEEKKSS